MGADEAYVGIDVHRASRICQAGHGGQVLASQAAARLVGRRRSDLGDYEFRGLRSPSGSSSSVADDLAADFPPLRNVRAHDHGLRA